MTKQQAISLMILEAKERLGSMKAAFDEVLGEGFYEKLKSDLYDALRAKEAA